MQTHTRQECRAQNPATCRHHGDPARKRKLSFAQFFNQRAGKITPVEPVKTKPYGLTIRNNDEKYREAILNDIAVNRKLKIDPRTGTKTVSIYRSGVPAPPTERGVEKTHYAHADAAAPADRQGRTSGVFAAATMDTAVRWYRANGNTYSKIEDYGLRELRVDPDTTYVYSVYNWEQASGALGGDTNPQPESPRFKAAVNKFWHESMTLTAWYQYVQDNPEVDTRDWEILVGVDDIQKVSPVGPKRILDGCIREYEQHDVAATIKREQRAKRDKRLYG